ncbi:hypothetical protein [Rosistilla carotiformis]|uniref:hypothetical protein n=1 Tax=Rosistilla carotiformis TaxID=2528017 RepID=UPI0011A23A2F|nr:hypothetical protein [Rosistilla carotiformis]
MPRIATLSRPIVRRIEPKLIVRITPDGVSIRGYRRRRWRDVSWAQLASLADDQLPLVKHCQLADGQEQLRKLGAIED